MTIPSDSESSESIDFSHLDGDYADRLRQLQDPRDYGQGGGSSVVARRASVVGQVGAAALGLSSSGRLPRTTSRSSIGANSPAFHRRGLSRRTSVSSVSSVASGDIPAVKVTKNMNAEMFLDEGESIPPQYLIRIQKGSTQFNYDIRELAFSLAVNEGVADWGKPRNQFSSEDLEAIKEKFQAVIDESEIEFPGEHTPLSVLNKIGDKILVALRLESVDPFSDEDPDKMANLKVIDELHGMIRGATTENLKSAAISDVLGKINDLDQESSIRIFLENKTFPKGNMRMNYVKSFMENQSANSSICAKEIFNPLKEFILSIKGSDLGAIESGDEDSEGKIE